VRIFVDRREDVRNPRLARVPARYTTSMADQQVVLEPDPVIEVYKKDIDRTLLRENLKLTPEQRLEKLTAAVRGLLDLRDAFAKSRR
jgi:hypothetical protein